MFLRVFITNGCRERFLLYIFGQSCRLISYRSDEYESALNSALKLLEITVESEEAEIRKAYLDKAKIYHPDSLSDSADPKQFAKVTTILFYIINF